MVTYARARVLLEVSPSPEDIRAFGDASLTANVAARLIVTLRGIVDETAPRSHAAATVPADVEMAAEDVDAAPAVE